MNRNSIIEQLKNEIIGLEAGPSVSHVGEIISVSDGVAKIRGLQNARASEMLEFQTEKGTVLGLALNLEEDSIGAIILGDAEDVKEGQKVKALGQILSIPVGEALIGRVLNPLGEAIDGKGPIKTEGLERQ